jgi:hypothetical protein
MLPEHQRSTPKWGCSKWSSSMFHTIFIFFNLYVSSSSAAPATDVAAAAAVMVIIFVVVVIIVISNSNITVVELLNSTQLNTSVIFITQTGN